MNQNLEKRYEVLVKKTYYIHKRYNLESTFALLYHKEPLSLVQLSAYARISDYIIEVDENNYFIIFQFTSEEDAYKASQNIIGKLEVNFCSHAFYIGLHKININMTPQNILKKLRLIVEYAIKNRFNRVETEEVLDL